MSFAQSTNFGDHGDVQLLGTVSEFGFVKKIVFPQGYAFIIPDSGGEDIFIGSTTIEQSKIDPFVEGIRISYRVIKIKERLRAIDLKLIKGVNYPNGDFCTGTQCNDGIFFEPLFPNPNQWINGMLKWYNPEKGYGFVTFEENIRDVLLTKQVFATLPGGNENTRVENLSVKVKIIACRKPGMFQVKAISLK